MATLLVNAAVNIGVGLALNLLFPPRGQDITQEGPRLDDLSVTSAAYGRPINIGYGSHRYGGNIIWSSGIIEEVATDTQSAGGKGGGGGSVTTTTYTYFASFAIGVAEGPADDFLRIWGDGKLIFDKTGTGIGLSNPGIQVRFYPGNETQLPDPLIESIEGAGNVSAHRGLCYIVFERLPLADYGNRIPQITVEVAFNATKSLPWTALNEIAGTPTPARFFIDPFSDSLYTFRNLFDGNARSSLATMTMLARHLGEHGLQGRLPIYGMDDFIYMQDGPSNRSRIRQVDPQTMLSTGVFFGNNGIFIDWPSGIPFRFPNGLSFGVLRILTPIGDPIDIYVATANNPPLGGGGGVQCFTENEEGVLTWFNFISDTRLGDYGGVIIQDYFNRRLFFTQEDSTNIDFWELDPGINISLLGKVYAVPEPRKIATYSKATYFGSTANVRAWCLLPDEEAVILSSGAGLRMFKISLNDGSVLATSDTHGFSSEDNWTTNGRFAFTDGQFGPGNGSIFVIDTDDLSEIEELPLSLAPGFGAQQQNTAINAYDPRTDSLIVNRVNGPGSVDTNRIVRVLLSRASGAGVPLSDVVTDICRRAGLAAADIDVTDLVSETVRGYVINRQGSARAALEPLTRGYLFEGVESDWQVKLVRRGGSSVVTIPADDVGLISGDQEPIERPRDQEVELPSSVSVTYADPDADYQPSNQIAQRISGPVRTQNADNNVSIEFPIVFTSEEGRRLAERLLYTAWAERSRLNTALTWEYLALDPTDIIEMQVGADLLRLRLAEIEVGADLAIELVATQEDARSNDSSAPGVGGGGLVPQAVPSGFPTKYLPLDLPLLFAVDTSLQQFSRAYWAASGYDAEWPGSRLFRSSDQGQTFSAVGQATVPAAWGVVDGTLPDPGTTATWDESSTVDVKVIAGIDRFESATDAEVLGGANSLAIIRADGLPEIVQFVNVESVDVGTVRLSRLLRGRRGTDAEETARNHGANETVVLLEPGRVLTFPLPLDLIDVAAQYRAETLGQPLEDAPTIFDRRTGQDLVPYAPAHLRGSRDGGGNLTVSWVRRTRYNADGPTTDDVPLNEQLERYDLEIPFAGSTRIAATVDDTTEYAISVADWGAAGGLSGELPLVNRDFETTDGWSLGNGASYQSAVGALGPQSGSQFVWMGGLAQTSLQINQVIDLLAAGYESASLDNERPLCTLDYWHAETDPANVDTSQALVEFIDADDAVISSLDSGTVAPSPINTWVENSISGNLPAGARKLRVRFWATRGGGSSLGVPQIAFDNVRLTLGSGVPPLPLRIWQRSAIVGRGRETSAIV